MGVALTCTASKSGWSARPATVPSALRTAETPTDSRTFSTTTSAFTAKVQFDLNVRGRPDELQAVTANSVHEDNATASVAAASTADGAETVPPSPKPPNADRSAFSSP